MNLARRLRSIRPADPQRVIHVNAGQSNSIVGSENDLIARATSLLFSMERSRCGPCLTPDQARDVLRWAESTPSTGVRHG